jgi:hypothetical protein
VICVYNTVKLQSKCLEYIYFKMRNDDRHRLRQHQNQITIECPSQIIQISSDSYGSLLNQNIRLGSNKICITQNGQQVWLYN